MPDIEIDLTNATPDEMREVIRNAAEIIDKQNEVLDALKEPKGRPATFVGYRTMMIDSDKGPEQIACIKGGPGPVTFVGIAPHVEALGLREGDTVLIHDRAPIIVGVTETEPFGQPVNIERVIDECAFEIEGGEIVDQCDRLTDELEPGDSVFLDLSRSYIVAKAPAKKQAFAAPEITGVTWDDIGGQHKAKAEMREAIEGATKHAALFQAYGKRQTKGLLLFGPPGTGKTMFGKAAAASLAEQHGSSENGFIYVKGPEVLNAYVGESEANVRRIFARARKHYQRHGFPAVVFIDEADAVLGNRTRRESSGMSKTVVPAFLAEMDGLEDSGAIVILTTNRPDTLDPAITRDGRIDRKVKVGRPSRDEAREIFRIALEGKPIRGELDSLASDFTTAVYSKWAGLLCVTTEAGKEKIFGLSALISGAMIVGLVEQAVSFAMRRDIAAGEEVPSGICLTDISEAVATVVEQNRAIDHSDALAEFLEGEPVKEIRELHHEKVA